MTVQWLYSRSNAGRIFCLSTGTYLSILFTVFGIFGCFEIWASKVSPHWPGVAYAGLIVLGAFKIIGAFMVCLVFHLRTPWVTQFTGYATLVYVPLSVIWLIVCWITWGKSSDVLTPSWETAFRIFETCFVAASVLLLWWTTTAFFSAARIQKVGGRGFEGRRWTKVVEYMKLRNRREAERLVKAENWLAAEIAFDEKHRAYVTEQNAHKKQKQAEQREEAKKVAQDRAAEAKQNKLEKQAQKKKSKSSGGAISKGGSPNTGPASVPIHDAGSFI